MPHRILHGDLSIVVWQALAFFVTFLVGDITAAVTALAAVITIDYITGFIAAALNGQWNSTTSIRGIAIKFGFLGIVGAAFHIGTLMGAPILFRKAFILIFVAHEFGSILENVNKFGKDHEAVPEPIHKLAKKIIEEAK